MPAGAVERRDVDLVVSAVCLLPGDVRHPANIRDGGGGGSLGRIDVERGAHQLPAGAVERCDIDARVGAVILLPSYVRNSTDVRNARPDVVLIRRGIQRATD